MLLDEAALHDRLGRARTLRRRGRVVEAFGTVVRATGLDAHIGQEAEIVDPVSGASIAAMVVGLARDSVLLMPLASFDGVSASAEVIVKAQRAETPAGPGVLGRVLDARGVPLDGLGPLPSGGAMRPIYAAPPEPLSRRPISTQFATGVRALDGLTPVGIGQRLGLFAMAGAGKSTLLGMIARHSAADVNVIALIGERGREVGEFLADNLGPQGLAKSVVIVATSDRPPMERVRAAHAACAIAEGFRAEGRDVLLVMDSITRFARALREIGLAVGEPAVRRGLPPSVFTELPKLFERAGNDEAGSITAFYSVLVEDEDGLDPIGEETRSLLDGHIVLARKSAAAGLYPAIDAPASLSRLAARVTNRIHQDQAARVRAWLAKHQDIELLLQIGEFKEGGDPLADQAVAKLPAIRAFLRQPPEEYAPLALTQARLGELAAA